MFDRFNFLDLTHTLHPYIPTWTGSCGFQQEIKLDYPQGCRVQSVSMHAGVGTHIDAPSHFFEKGKNIAELPLEDLIVQACVIDVSSRTHADYRVVMEDIHHFENKYGAIAPHTLVIVHTGWGKFWPDPQGYRNLDAEGQMHFPAFSPEVAEYLVGRNIAGIAIDTLSPDCSSSYFPVHYHVLGAGKYIIENIAHCDQMPPIGAYVLALPPKVQGGTEAPLRVVGITPK